MGKFFLSSLVLFVFPGNAVADVANSTVYAAIIAKNCQISTGGASERFFARRINMDEKNIRILKLQKGWKGWLRVHAISRVDGGMLWGYADVHMRSGKVICDARNWEVRLRGARNSE